MREVLLFTKISYTTDWAETSWFCGLAIRAANLNALDPPVSRDLPDQISSIPQKSMGNAQSSPSTDAVL
jgi:hypothetical protein